MRNWFRNVYQAVVTVAAALWVCLRYWLRTYDPKRKTFTEQYEYPELPVDGFPAFSRFSPLRLDDVHRLRAVCARLPGRLHFHRQGARGGAKGFPGHELHDRLRQVHVLRHLHRELPGRLRFHGLVVRSELLQPGRLHRGFLAASARGGVGPCDAESHGGGQLEGHCAGRFTAVQVRRLRSATVDGGFAPRLAKSPASPTMIRLSASLLVPRRGSSFRNDVADRHCRLLGAVRHGWVSVRAGVPVCWEGCCGPIRRRRRSWRPTSAASRPSGRGRSSSTCGSTSWRWCS